MGSVAVACYKPKPGRDAELLELVWNRLPILSAEGLVTDREPIIMKCADGTIVEVFEWESPAAIERAHKNSAALDLWKQFEEVSDYVIPASIAEFQTLFAHFATP
jgi:hypothetical protein